MHLRYAGLRLPRIALAFVVALGLLLGGFQLWQVQRVDRPLVAAIGSVAGVAAVQLDEAGDAPLQVVVDLGLVDDLRATYLAIEDAARRVLGARPFTLEVSGAADPALEEDFRAARLAVAEGVETGRYTDMAQKVADIAARAGARGRVDVDGRFVFVQFDRGGLAVYEVVPRQVAAPGVGPEGGGSA
jgi:hypothetical protein